ncbi:DUF3145 domain-containing protein [Micrococcus sp.]|uniref:DUF3145 domain-containing protein n=1 Tax=Micrococcus sp. TaxID=1271 RepID=UPI002A916893|nr:DUF3145 domain-containing protein [Micrococcus sp.]MDY6054309.1 DUF3145 domain-containing protein [Micrococcus sp.]
MSTTLTRGTVHILSAPTALCPHVEWALGSVLGLDTPVEWQRQSAAPGEHRTELRWTAPQGTGARLASALRGWPRLRFEITEEPSAGADGSRWSHTPDLGIFHATTDVSGNIMVSEDRIRHAYEAGRGDPSVVFHELSLALGEAWDEELEPFRLAAAGAPIRWLHRAG